MSTTKLAVSLLFVLTLVFIVGLSRYQLIISHKRLPPVFRPVSPAVALKLNHTIENNTATSAGNTMIPWYNRAGRLKFDAPVTFANPIWKQAHVSRSRATFGHFQFHYVINSVETCRSKHDPESPVFLLNYVHSAVGNFARRARVRASWARRSNYPNDRVETVFFVGLPSGDRRQTTQAAVEAEFHQFRDIVQVNVVDSYRYGSV